MTTTTTRASAHTRWGLAVLLLPAMLVSMDISILFVASPAIAGDLVPSATQWLWMMDVYSFVLAGLLVTMGSLADRIGRRRLLMIGSALFGGASLLLTYAPSAELFIAGRALLGIAASTLAPSTLALIRGMFADESRRRSAVAAWTVVFTGGAVAGPVLGGLLLEHFWWGSVFLVNLPVMAVLLIAAPLLVPESRGPDRSHFDVTGALLSLTGIVGVVFAAKHIADEGVDALGIGSAVIGLVLLALFVRQQRSAAHPLIDMSLFQRAAFSASVIANMLATFTMVGLGLLAFTYAQAVHGLSALHAALVALPTLAGTITGAVLASALAHRLRPAVLVPAGLLIGAAGMITIALTDHTTSIAPFITGYTVLTLGVGIVSTMVNSLILTTATPDRAGAAASVSETGMTLGEALGIATFGTISAFVYRAHMEHATIEAIPAAAAETINGALAVTSSLPADEAAALRQTAFDAFTNGLTTVATASAAILVLAALITALALRVVPRSEAADDAQIPTRD